MRIDKWLWAARFYKTRRLAVEAIGKGQILVAGGKVKPSRSVAINDEISIKKGDELFEITVLLLIEQRGPASVAVTMYSESEESQERRAQLREQKKLEYSPKPMKSPDKKDRSLLRQLRKGY